MFFSVLQKNDLALQKALFYSFQKIYNARCNWSMTLFIFFSKGRMQASIINMAANLRGWTVFLKTKKNRSRVYYIELYCRNTWEVV